MGDHMNAKLEQYRVFCSVAEQGSISAAARQLYLSQSAVSQDIRSLEESLGTRLFTRMPRGVSLTSDGQTLAKSLDFKFRNNSNFPLYIVAYLDSSSNYNKTRKVTVEVYGASLGQGVTVKLITDCYEYTPAPAEPRLTYDPTMEYGTETVVVKARDGYKYHTYRVYYYNGTETKRELLRNSTYRVYQQEIKYNGTR